MVVVMRVGDGRRGGGVARVEYHVVLQHGICIYLYRLLYAICTAVAAPPLSLSTTIGLPARAIDSTVASVPGPPCTTCVQRVWMCGYRCAKGSVRPGVWRRAAHRYSACV